MGVDHTAFACYGQRIEVVGRVQQDDLDEKIPSACRVGIVDWGSRPYGGPWGFVLVLRESYAEIDFDRGVGIRALPRDRDWDQVGAVSRFHDAIHALKQAGFEVVTQGESGWLVGGRTW